MAFAAPHALPKCPVATNSIKINSSCFSFCYHHYPQYEHAHIWMAGDKYYSIAVVSRGQELAEVGTGHPGRGNAHLEELKTAMEDENGKMKY